MLDYSYDLLIPFNTPQLSPVTSDVKLSKGILKRIHISFEAGCGYMAYTSIELMGTQIAPLVETQAYHFDAFTYIAEVDIPLEINPYEVTIKGWSPNTLYPHTLHYVFSVEPNTGNTDMENLLSLLVARHA